MAVKQLRAQSIRQILSDLLEGATAPATAGGVAAPVGSLYRLNLPTNPSVHVKTSAPDTGWDQIPITAINVKAYGAVGDGVTDDRAAIQAALNAAIARGLDLYFPPGTYYISQYIYMTGAIGMTVWASGATVVYPSDNTSLHADSIANNDNAARSGFIIKWSHDVVFHKITWKGGQSRIIDQANVGSGLWVKNSQRITQFHCKALYGGSLHQQDQQPDTSGTGVSLTVVGGAVTLVATTSIFNAGDVGLRLSLAGCTNPANNGVYTVGAYVSGTTVTFTNAQAVNEVSAFRLTVENGDYGTLLDTCDQDRSRYINTLPSHSEVRGGWYRWPTEDQDICGRGDALTLNGTTVTLTDYQGRFSPNHQGKFLQIANATSGGNNGIFSPITYISATQISFPNAAGVTEDYSGNWWIISGTKLGTGAGAGAIAKSGTTITLTASSPLFDGSEVGMCVRLVNPTSSVNRETENTVSAVLGPTQIQYTQSNAVAEDFSGVFSLDDFDESGGAGSACGSTHGFYIFSGNNGFPGRSHILFDGVHFIGNRTACVKVSGSATPVRDVLVRNCIFTNCDAIFVGGADDSQEHTSLTVIDCVTVDCGPIHRRGQVVNPIINILGARGVLLANNTHYFTRESIFSQYTSTGGLYGYFCERYDSNASQPLEDLTISNNVFTADPAAVKYGSKIFEDAIRVQRAGQRQKCHTGGTLTKQLTTVTMTINAAAGTITRTGGSWLTDGYIQGGAIVTSGFVNGGNNASWTIAAVTALTITVTSNVGMVNETKAGATSTNNVMKLTDGAANFLASEDVGKSITILNAPDAGNNGTFLVQTVPTSSQVAWTNAAGVGGAVSAGTWRLTERAGIRAGMLKIENNKVFNVANYGVYVTNSIGPSIRGNHFNNCSWNVYLDTSCFPEVIGNRDYGSSADNASGGGIHPRIQIAPDVSWPTIYDNLTIAQLSGGANGKQWGIAISGPVAYDYPLLGKYVRARPSAGQEEVVFAYGVDGTATDGSDGDTLTIAYLSVNYVFTRKGTAPGANQFNSMASLLALINAIPGLTAADYGTGLAGGDVPTGHIRVRTTAVSVTNGNLTVKSSPIHGNALVCLNDNGSQNTQCASIGAASAGPVADKVCLWSPVPNYPGVTALIPDNTDARAVLQANGPAMANSTAASQGSSVEMVVGDTSAHATAEFRAVMY